MRELEDLIFDTPEVTRSLVAKKQVVQIEKTICTIGTEERISVKEIGSETTCRHVVLYGNEDLGYIASHEECFSAVGNTEIEFHEVLFQTGIHDTADGALLDATDFDATKL